MERRKTKAIAAKRQKVRRGTSLSSKEEESYKSNTKNKIDPDQANNEYPL